MTLPTNSSPRRKRVPGGKVPTNGFLSRAFFAKFLYSELDRVTLTEKRVGGTSDVLGHSELNYQAIARLISPALPAEHTIRVAGAKGRGADGSFSIPCHRYFPARIYRNLYELAGGLEQETELNLKRLALHEQWEDFARVLFANFGALYLTTPSVQELYADAATYAAGIQLYISKHGQLFAEQPESIRQLVRSGSITPILRLAHQTKVPESLAIATWVLLFEREGSKAATEALFDKGNWEPLEALLWTPVSPIYKDTEPFLEMKDVLSGTRSAGPGVGRIPTKRRSPKASGAEAAHHAPASAVSPEPRDPSPTPASAVPPVAARQSPVARAKNDEADLFTQNDQQPGNGSGA